MGLFFNHVVPALFYVLKKLTYPLALGSSLLSLAFDRTPAIGEGPEKASGANAVNKSLPGALKDMVGTWKLQEKINVDQFMAGLGINRAKRAALRLAGQEYELLADKSALTIVTKDLRGHSALKLPLDGRGVVANDGDDGAAVRRAVRVLTDALVMTETLVGESKPLSVCRRTLQRDGRMRMDISKRTPDGQTVSMAAIATRARPPRLVHQC